MSAQRDGAAFDAVAAEYDRAFTRSPTGRLQRERVHAYLRRVPLGAGRAALELGCGTGEDALFLASRGYRVVATDGSPAMLAVARAKAAAARAEVAFEILDLRALDAWAGGRFDLVFSNFGALNCLSPDELRAVGSAAGRLVHPGGHVLLVVMPRACLWESAYFGLRLRLPSALRRLRRGPTLASLGTTRVPTWYHSPGDVRGAFPAFRQIAQRPIGLWLPPSYLDRLFVGRPAWLARLARLERRFAPSALAGLADHCLVHLQRADER